MHNLHIGIFSDKLFKKYTNKFKWNVIIEKRTIIKNQFVETRNTAVNPKGAGTGLCQFN